MGFTLDLLARYFDITSLTDFSHIVPFFTKIKNLVITEVTDPILSSLITDLFDPILAEIAKIPTNLTQSWITSILDTIQTNILNSLTTSFLSGFNTYNIKNTMLNIFINPIIAKLNPFNPPDAPYKLVYDQLDNLKVDTDSAFSNGSFRIAWIFYDIVRRVYSAIHEIISESTEWFNDHVAGTEINFPIPLFSGKAIKIATRVGEVWEPNNDLLMPYISKEDFGDVFTKYPWLDVFPFNVELYDDLLFENDVLRYDENSSSWISTDGYMKSDLCYDIICVIMIALITYAMVKIGWGRHVDKMTRKMNKAMALSKEGQFLYNDIKVKNSNNKALMYLLMLATRGSSTNANNIALNLGNISGLDDVFDQLSVVADDDTVEIEIRTQASEILERVKKLYAGSYT